LGIVTIQFKKLLTGEPGEVNSLNSILRGGFTQEKSRHGKSLFMAMLSRGRKAPDRMTGAEVRCL
jgi:hypothetical protein